MVAEEVRKLEAENSTLKDQIKRLEEDYGVTASMAKDCEHCRNFIQHYVRCGRGYAPAYDGHCVAGGRIRKRKVNESCRSFVAMQFGKNFI